MRRVPSIDALIPVLYLKGVSTGDFEEALRAILGPNATGLSTANTVRLKEGWQLRDLKKRGLKEAQVLEGAHPSTLKTAC